MVTAFDAKYFELCKRQAAKTGGSVGAARQNGFQVALLPSSSLFMALTMRHCSLWKVISGRKVSFA
jgi:hypothetical protein